MPAMWAQGGFRGSGGSSETAAGAALLLVTCALYGYILGRLKVEGREPAPSVTPWWFGYARDLLNLGTLGGLFLGLMLLGFVPPLALLTGFLLAILMHLAHVALGGGLGLRSAGIWAGTLGVAVGLLLTREPARAAGCLVQALTYLFKS
jgi:hypothetical protein